MQGNIADEDLLKMIPAEPNRSALGGDDLLKLKQAGVPDAVIAAMRKNK